MYLDEYLDYYDNYKENDDYIFILNYLNDLKKEFLEEELFITESIDKDFFTKRISDDLIINLTGESGSGKSYFSSKWKDDDNYIIIDTDIVFSDKESDNKECIELRKIFSDKQKDYLITNFDDFYLEILKFFKDSEKFIVIDSAQYRNIKDVSILKGEVIVMRTSINKCYERCIERWKSRNKDYVERNGIIIYGKLFFRN